MFIILFTLWNLKTIPQGESDILRFCFVTIFISLTFFLHSFNRINSCPVSKTKQLKPIAALIFQ